MHEYGPVILIFAGIWMNRRDYSELQTDLKADLSHVQADLKAGISDVKADTNRQFAAVNGRLDRIEVRLDKMDESIIKFTRLEGRVEELSRR